VLQAGTGLPVLAPDTSGRLGTFAVGLFVSVGRDLSRERNHFRLRHLRAAWPKQIAQNLYEGTSRLGVRARKLQARTRVQVVFGPSAHGSLLIWNSDNVGMIIARKPLQGNAQQGHSSSPMGPDPLESRRIAPTLARSLQADMQGELRNIERAAVIGTRDAGRGLKTELRRKAAEHPNPRQGLRS
jgi:hypothetical protein